MKKKPQIAHLESVSVMVDVQTVDIALSDLSVVEIGGALCFYYKSRDGDLIIPIEKGISSERKNLQTTHQERTEERD